MAARLSIGIPSNRPLARSRDSIASALDFCLRNGYNLVVSDNSGDAEKRAWLQEIMRGEQLVHIDSQPCEMMDNWFQAFHATTGDFVLMMGDDDTIFGYDVAPAFDDIPADVVGIRPTVAGYGQAEGILRMYNNAITANTGAERVLEYLKSANGANLGIFTFWRRDVFEPIMNMWLKNHPTKSTYCDWAVMAALSSCGKVLRHPTGCYFYNLQNWLGDAAFVSAQVEKAYAKGGLPAGTVAYERVLNAIDSFIFINREASPLPYEERFIAAAFTMDLYLKPYRENLPVASRHANAAEINRISQKLVGEDDIPTILNILLEIMDAIQPGLAQRYRDFNTVATGRAWATF